MKIKNKTSGQIIDVPSEHGNMLLTQGWVEFNEVQQERMVICEAKISSETESIKTESAKKEVLKRGRPKKA